MGPLLAFHRHFLAADAVKEVMFAPIAHAAETDLPAEVVELAQVWSSMLRMQVFYALMYVVIEGYRALKFEDEAVDLLLKNDAMVESFRRFRNAIFHFQKDPLSPKLVEFLQADGSEKWAQELHAAFRAFFLRVLPIQEFKNELKRT